MSALRTLTARLGALFCRHRDEEGLADEIAAHLDLLAAEYRRREQGLVVAAIGAAIGVGIADGAGRLASSWLYEVRPSDPWILGSALAVVVGVTVVATLIPVGLAARIDPAPLLRLE